MLRQSGVQSEVSNRVKIAAVYELEMSADQLIDSLMCLAASEPVFVLDSCGVGNLGSHLLVAGIEPLTVCEVTNDDAGKTLEWFERSLNHKNEASIFTISYDLGKKLLAINPDGQKAPAAEPDIFLAKFDVLVIHDYETGVTRLVGNESKFQHLSHKLASQIGFDPEQCALKPTSVRSNYSREEYLDLIDAIKEQIRCGNTYQTNFTQQLSAKLPAETTPESIFYRLRRDHPAPFSAYIKRPSSAVVSASPERFVKIDQTSRVTSTSPIKGTRPRGQTPGEDTALRSELLASAKDRAENIMIVDLLRNDLGRVSEYGSVTVEKLCELETHPTFFHLVSTIKGRLKRSVSISDILAAIFPCGSITGAPKISTMRIIDRLESAPRGLSMGAIGYHIPENYFGCPPTLDMSVAIRTMVVRDGVATFNVGGGIVIDSDPEKEYEESLTKAKALLSAINGYLQ